MKISNIKPLLALTLLFLASPQSAFAYIDPGSGSVVMTAIFGFIAAIAYTFRKYFYRLRKLFGGKSPDEEINQEDE